MLSLVFTSVSEKLKLVKEISVMLSFNHPNVMSLIGLCLNGDVPLLIMPFMSDGSVLDYVRRNREHLYFTNNDSSESEVG